MFIYVFKCKRIYTYLYAKAYTLMRSIHVWTCICVQAVHPQKRARQKCAVKSAPTKARPQKRVCQKRTRQKRAVKSAPSKTCRQKRKVLKHDVLNSVCKNVVLLKNVVFLYNTTYYKNKINTYSTMLFNVQIRFEPDQARDYAQIRWLHHHLRCV